MKKIYKIGTKQNFTHTTLLYKVSGFFKKNIEIEEHIEEHWVVRNVKYIYANNREEAKDKYEKWFFKEYKKIISGWGNWYCKSDGVDLMTMNDKNINIISTKIVSIDENEDIDINLETLRDNMQAENFREWWFDGAINT